MSAEPVSVSRQRISPVWIVSLLALFFALGGSALAVGLKTVPQARCAQGAVRGIAVVTGGNTAIGNMADTFSSSSSLFNKRFNCGGGAIEVRRVDRGVYELKFDGNVANTVVASAGTDDGAGVSVTQKPGGAFRITIGAHDPVSLIWKAEDAPFTVVLF